MRGFLSRGRNKVKVTQTALRLRRIALDELFFFFTSNPHPTVFVVHEFNLDVSALCVALISGHVLCFLDVSLLFRVSRGRYLLC